MTLDKGFWTICNRESELGISEHVFIDLCFLTMDTMSCIQQVYNKYTILYTTVLDVPA